MFFVSKKTLLLPLINKMFSEKIATKNRNRFIFRKHSLIDATLIKNDEFWRTNTPQNSPLFSFFHMFGNVLRFAIWYRNEVLEDHYERCCYSHGLVAKTSTFHTRLPCSNRRQGQNSTCKSHRRRNFEMLTLLCSCDRSHTDRSCVDLFVSKKRIQVM